MFFFLSFFDLREFSFHFLDIKIDDMELNVV